MLNQQRGSVILGIEHGHHHVTQGHGDAHGGHFDPQDMRNMGGMASRMKVTFAVYLTGALALAGIPPLAGFCWSSSAGRDRRLRRTPSRIPRWSCSPLWCWPR